jgi:hypothetical protein
LPAPFLLLIAIFSPLSLAPSSNLPFSPFLYRFFSSFSLSSPGLSILSPRYVAGIFTSCSVISWSNSWVVGRNTRWCEMVVCGRCCSQVLWGLTRRTAVLIVWVCIRRSQLLRYRPRRVREVWMGGVYFVVVGLVFDDFWR